MKASIGGGGGFTLLEDDVYPARIYSIVDIGQQQTPYGEKRQIIITWEIPGEMVDGLPYAISKYYTLSLNDKATLLKDIEAMGKPLPMDKRATFDFTKLIGKTCQLNIQKYEKKDGNERNKIIGISKLMKGIEVGPQVNESIFFDLDEPSDAVYNSLPDWQKKQIVFEPKKAEVSDEGAPFDLDDDDWD